jgi:hypothetical protein
MVDIVAAITAILLLSLVTIFTRIGGVWAMKLRTDRGLSGIHVSLCSDSNCSPDNDQSRLTYLACSRRGRARDDREP